MKSILILALNDLRLTTRDRTSFIWMIVMPVAMMWFFGGIGGGGGGTNPITLNVINEDDGWLADALIDELHTEQINLSVHGPDDAPPHEERTRSLIIPAGFTAGVLASERQVLRLEKEPGSNVDYGVAAESHLARAAVRVQTLLAEMGPRASDPEALATYRSLAEQPPPVGLTVSTAGQGRQVPSGLNQSVPGNMTFVVLMMTLIYGGVFLTVERSTGMLRRQGVLPMSRRDIFLGKLAGRMLIAACQLVPLVLAGRFLFGVSWGRSPIALIVVLFCYALAVGSLATLLGSVLRTPAQASSVGWITAMVLAALGGCWWPAEIMPDWMRTASHVLPTAWAMDAFHALISFGQGIDAVLLPCAVLIGFAAVFAALGARFFSFASA